MSTRSENTEDRYQERASWTDAQQQREHEIQKSIDENEGKDFNEIRPRYWGPRLFIRGNASDTGVRPTNHDYYLSPDIVVESGDPAGRPIAERPNFVWVRIWNLGRAPAAPVKIDFYWANPALGLGPGDMNPISGNKPEWVIVPPLSAGRGLGKAWVRCETPWIPTFVNDGHECLFVDCDNYLLDPLIYPCQPMLDRHAGQRNYTILPAQPGAKVKFTLQFNNIFSHASTALLSLRTSHLALTERPKGLFEFNEALGLLVTHGLPHPVARESARRRAATRATRPLSIDEATKIHARPERTAVREIFRPGVAASVETSIDERSAIRVYPNADAYVGRLYLMRDRLREGPPTATLLHRVGMQAFEQRHLTLELGVPAGAQPGEFVVFHLAQENDRFLMGGYAIVIQVTD